jgi:hypothetical protein
MEPQTITTSSNSSSFEDLTKDNDLKEESARDELFMDILGNDQLTKKVSELRNVNRSRL